jgi:protoheme IX farnesyltransferase
MLSIIIKGVTANSAISALRKQAIDYCELTKPRITTLVLVTTFVGMWVAGSGSVNVALIFYTLLGTGLASASSATFNNYIDRGIDVRMARTSNRALPSGRLSARSAFIFGTVLAIAAFTVLSLFTNDLTAWLAIFTIFFYVFIYTLWLKRYSTLCTEVGGVAGALPPVIGWTAVTNEVTWPAALLFLIIFLWQPPHFWALALVRADEYKKANIPMLPVIKGTRLTKFRMLLYTISLIPTTVSMYFFGLNGIIFLILSSVLGITYLVLTINFIRKPVTIKSARRLFNFSILYLLGIFSLIFVDLELNGLII